MLHSMPDDEQPPAKRAKGDEDRNEVDQPTPANHVKMVRLPGREVNPQRARLWQQLCSNSLLFDVTLRASDRDVPCNRYILARALKET